MLGVALALSPAVALEPVPSFYQEPGLPSTREVMSQQIHESIDPFTGKLQIHQVDLHLPGNGGLDIDLQRGYSSIDENLGEPTVVGVGWTLHYGRVLRRAKLTICASNAFASNQPVLELPDGSRSILYPTSLPGQNYWITTTRWRADCAAGGLGLIVTSPQGVRYEMTTPGPMQGPPGASQNSWYTTRIVDRNQNTLDFTYQNLPNGLAMTSIRASDGRLVTLTYSAGTLSTISDGSRTWTYQYTAGPGSQFPFLTAVLRPADVGGQWTYDYYLDPGQRAGRYSLKTLQYPTGGSYRYTYGRVSFNASLPAATVVTSKSGDGGSWQYIYTPASLSCEQNSSGFSCKPDSGMLDKTTVLAPDTTYVYEHIGANSVGPGNVWAIGLSQLKIIGSDRFEQTMWACQPISNIVNVRPGNAAAFDNGVCAPLVYRRDINQYGQIYDTRLGQFDAYGNALASVESGPAGDGTMISRSTVRSFAVDPQRWLLRLLTSSVSDSGVRLQRSFDANGNILTESKQGVMTRYTYTAEGDVASRTDARGNVSTYGSYYRGVPRRDALEEGVTVTREISDAGNVLAQTDGEGARVAYTWDSMNRLTRITHPLGNEVKVSWGANQRVVARGDYVETTTYDGFGRPSMVTHRDSRSGESIAQSYRYDAVGRKVFSSYLGTANSGEGVLYNDLGDIRSLLHAVDPALSQPNGGVATQYQLGNQTQKVDELGRKTTLTYRSYGDPAERLLMRIESDLEPATNTLMSRNGLGQLTSITQDGKTRSFAFDQNAFLVSVLNPESGLTVFGRDAVGNMITRQIGTAPATRFTYDRRNRLVGVTYADGSPAVTRSYYRDERPKRVDNQIAQRDFVFDSNKNLITESLNYDTKTFVVRYTYDGNDTLARMTYGSGMMVDYAPNAFARPTQAAPYVSSVQYHPDGTPAQWIYENGVTTQISLDARQRPTAFETAYGGLPIASSSYQFDAVNNVVTIADAIDSRWSRSFVYDGVDRLIGVDLPQAPGGSITYDGRGNIRSQNMLGTATSYAYDPNTDRLLSVTGAQSRLFQYDAYGNVVSNGLHQFRYSDAQNLTCQDCNQPNAIVYAYDGAGNRLSATRADGMRTYTVFDSKGRLLWESSSSIGLREHVYLLGHEVATRQVK